MIVAPLAGRPEEAVRVALLSFGWEGDLARSTAAGLESLAYRIDGLDQAGVEALLRLGGKLGLEVVTGEGWTLLAGGRARLSALARPWTVPEPLGELAVALGHALPSESPVLWQTARGPVALEAPVLVGILNLTPDSFSDGGKYDTKDKAVKRAMQIADEGASILDLGGESTRPGADPVKPSDEQKRVLPVLEALFKAEYPLPISIDTRHATTAEKALAAGASIVNDVSGLRFDADMADVAARASVPVILTHSRGTPKDMADKAVYHDLPAEVIAELRDAMAAAREAGIDPANLLLDPGIGFAKDAEQSVEVLRSLPELRTLGRPIVVGPSRKSFLKRLGADGEDERAGLGTAAAVAACAYAGAHIVRVHDVEQAVKVLKVVDGVRRMA